MVTCLDGRLSMFTFCVLEIFMAVSQLAFPFLLLNIGKYIVQIVALLNIVYLFSTITTWTQSREAEAFKNMLTKVNAVIFELKINDHVPPNSSVIELLFTLLYTSFTLRLLL